MVFSICLIKVVICGVSRLFQRVFPASLIGGECLENKVVQLIKLILAHSNFRPIWVDFLMPGDVHQAGTFPEKGLASVVNGEVGPSWCFQIELFFSPTKREVLFVLEMNNVGKQFF